MEGMLDLLVPLTRLCSYSVLVVVFFVFIVRPLLNYIIVNREIEQRKKLNEKMASNVASPPGQSTSHGASEENVVLPEDDSTDSGIVKGPGQQALNRLASSDADKAVDLVKQWVHGDSPK